MRKGITAAMGSIEYPSIASNPRPQATLMRAVTMGSTTPATVLKHRYSKVPITSRADTEQGYKFMLVTIDPAQHDRSAGDVDNGICIVLAVAECRTSR